MSTITISPSVEPSFGMPTSGHALAAAQPACWSPATGVTAAITGADRTYALAQGVLAFATKRRDGMGSPSSPPDC
ncbi:hypothetical protein P5P86_15960 [Nocardioides sp. BP30]|uniref:hypothetical protein n=1 Tax=Nocardioides sp. BP30 TaxID=3036374 RepID=UPI0024691D73|nr:hypothetical protein [Nocardioides sp. BP30]WGL51448.1 hypothetical protein P5P86_15960 [Nocardioides sp. BP30]